MVGIVQPHAGEPLTHSCDEDDDGKKDQDGLTPSMLRAHSFENDWLVIPLVCFQVL